MRVLTAALACLVLCLLPNAALAQQQEEGALLVIMDVSGSMDEGDGAGGTRIEGARAAATDLVEAVPEGTQIGLRVYGDEYGGSNREQGCQDTRLAVPIGPVESTGTDITSQIEDATPTGFTPIGFSLQQAAGDFTDQSNRSVVLVSDGEDTCGDPPACEVAEQLTQDGIEVRVDTIGLAIEDNQEAQDELTCIAETTGGSYVEAADAEELTERLSRVSTRAIEGWSAEGQDVDGGPIITDATAVEPGTTYLDDVVPGEARWYSFPVQEGEDVTVTLSEDGTVAYGCCLELNVTEPDQESRIGFENGYTDGVPKIYRTGTLDEGARASGDHYLSVVLDDDGEQALQYQLELQIEGDPSTTEPPTTDADEETTPNGADDAQSTEAGDDGAKEGQASSEGGADGGNGLLLTLVIVLGVAVAALGVAVIYLLRQSQRRSP